MKRQLLNMAMPINWKLIRERVYQYGIDNWLNRRKELLSKMTLKEWTFDHIIYSNKISQINIKKLKKFIKLDDLIVNTNLSNYETKYYI